MSVAWGCGQTAQQEGRPRQLWSATLNPSGPNYHAWTKILGVESVPLKSPTAVPAQLGPERDVEVYLLNLEAMTLPQRARLVASMAIRFRAPIYEIEAELKKKGGFPIRATDVIVSFDQRAFV